MFADGLSAPIDQVKNQIVPDNNGCKNQLLVDAGDFSQGTPYYNAWEGSESVMAMNAMGYHVSTLGNHEFDLGPTRLARVLSGDKITVAGVENTTELPAFRIVASNLDISGESSLKGLIKKYAVVERCSEKYGVIGVVTEYLPLITSAGKVTVQDYVTSVNATAALLKAMGINKIIHNATLYWSGSLIQRRLPQAVEQQGRRQDSGGLDL